MLASKKNGFALLYAIIFIAAVSSISVGYFVIVKNFYDRESKIDLESQYIRLLKDFPPVIEDKLSKIKTEADFEYFLRNELAYHFAKDNIDINITIKPINDKIFFSDMFDEGGNIKSQYGYVLSEMLDFYAIKYKKFFLDILQDAVDSDQFAREPDSEISAKIRSFQDGPYNSYDRLAQVVTYYKEQTGDDAIDSIQWPVFFNFYQKPQEYFIDCKIIPPHVYSLLSAYGDTTNFYDCQSFENSANFEKFKKSFNIISFNPKAKYSFLVETNITKNKTQNLEKKFIYESGSKKITYIR